MTTCGFEVAAGTDIAASEVPTLQHELWYYAMEFRAFVSKALFSGTQSNEVIDSPGCHPIEKLESDATGLIWRGCQKPRQNGLEPICL